MAELVESVKQHGIITPLTLSRHDDGRYAIIAGERRYRAAKAAQLREVPLPVRDRVSQEAAEKDGSLVHAGDCEQQWGSAYHEAGAESENDEEALDEAA